VEELGNTERDIVQPRLALVDELTGVGVMVMETDREVVKAGNGRGSADLRQRGLLRQLD
jgi:hypothetical protein